MFMSLHGMNIFTSLNHHLNEDFFFKFKKKNPNYTYSNWYVLNQIIDLKKIL